MGTHGQLADVYTDQRYKLCHSLRAGSLVLDGEPQPRADEKNGARKSEHFLASFFSEASVPEQVSLLADKTLSQLVTQH